MKVKTLVKKLNEACINKDKVVEKTLWWQILAKSLKHKKTQAAN
jgi:hypothetical protein